MLGLIVRGGYLEFVLSSVILVAGNMSVGKVRTLGKNNSVSPRHALLIYLAGSRTQISRET